MLTDERIAEIKGRLEKATPGPWEHTDGCVWHPIQVDDDEWEQEPICDCNPVGDGDFIAHAPTDLADLLAERDELLRDRERTIGYLEHLSSMKDPGEALASVARSNAFRFAADVVRDGVPKYMGVQAKEPSP